MIFVQMELDSLHHSLTFNPIKPLPCDRWLALSAMEKSIRRGDGLTAQRALRTLYQPDPSTPLRRLLIIAFEDVGIGALGAVVLTARRSMNAKALREMGRDEAAARATAQMLTETRKTAAPTCCSLLRCAIPPLRQCNRGVDRFRSLSGSNSSRIRPCRCPSALAAWHSSGVESWGEQRVGPGDLGSGLIDQSQKATAAAIQIADK